MKSKFICIFIFLSWISVLCTNGCSSTEIINSMTITPSLAKTRTSPIDQTPILLPFTGKIAFLWGDIDSDDNSVYVMNANGSEITEITPPDLRSKDNLSWSPDGKYIAFDASKDNTYQIFKMEANGSNLVQLTFGERDASRPSWSPDGEHILFMSSDTRILDDIGFPAIQIYIMNSDGSEVHRFMIDARYDNAPMSGFYRADGLIAVSEPDTRYSRKYYVVNSKGVIQNQFPELYSESPIEWSPDGKWIVYCGSRRILNDCLGFVLKKFDGSEKSCLVTDQAITSHIPGEVTWSPDGKYIMFPANLDGDNDIYIIKTDNSDLTRLTNLPGDEGGAVWWSAP